jgi:hypothetical protein
VRPRSCEPWPPARATGEIADELGISPLTAQSHVKSIPAKLGVHSKIEARRGWSELDEEVRPALVRRIQQVASDLAPTGPRQRRGSSRIR